MIRALIIDDEPHCIERIQSLAAELLPEKLHIMAGLADYDEALAAIRQYRPDLIFLDIQLAPDRTGFDLLGELGEQPVSVIFTTAYDRYAVKAFHFSALDYLLKPVGADELVEAVQKQIDRNPLVQTSSKIESLLGNLYGAGKRISIPVLTGVEILKLEDILYCISAVNYTTIYLKDKKKLTVAKVLKEFEEMLTEFNFCRIHNSHLINLAHVKAYNRGKGGFVQMSDGASLEVSTRRKDGFLEKLKRM